MKRPAQITKMEGKPTMNFHVVCHASRLFSAFDSRNKVETSTNYPDESAIDTICFELPVYVHMRGAIHGII